MVKLGWGQLSTAIMRNQLHRVVGRPRRGGHPTAAWSNMKRRDHAAWIFNTVSPHLGALEGRTGLEVGPGDNVDVCALCLGAGCRRMYAVERFATPVGVEGRLLVLRGEIEDTRLPEAVDFAYSSDAFEHVRDVPTAMKAVFVTLRPGGRFVCSIDLRGHNVFGIGSRPLDFLTCPDWLWRLMHSHIVTTNRVRVSEFVEAAMQAGFVVLESETLAAADAAYVHEIRPHLLPRYQAAPVEELRVLQLLLVLERPASA